MKINLLGMSFLDRLESWEVRNEHLVLRGFTAPVSRGHRSRSAAID
jgi:aspartyl protease family protein